MTRTFFRAAVALLLLLAAVLAFPGCSSKPAAAERKLDGVYHQAGNGPMTLTIKDGKAAMTIGTETQTLDYKVDGNTLTLINPKEGDTVFTINADGTLNSPIGAFTKSAG